MSEFGKDVLADKIHYEAVEKIIKDYGLSSTGNIYFSSKFRTLIDIKAFCVKGDEIYE
ncbi:MAG TPA: hypothetical protein PK263_03735 [bacterium]|nr:hypothetical protein [bacterium]